MSARGYGFCAACRSVVPAGATHRCPPNVSCLRCGTELPPARAGICDSCAARAALAVVVCKRCGGADPLPRESCTSMFHAVNRGGLR